MNKSPAINFDHPNITIIFGSPGSGKSTFIKYCVYVRAIKYQNFKRLFVLTSSAFTGEYDYVQEKYIIFNNFQEAVKRILALQEDEEPCLVIFDDVTGSIGWNKPEYDTLFTTCRKRKISILLAIHYANKLTPLIRETADNAVIFDQETKRATEALYESYGQQFENYKEFQRFLAKNVKASKNNPETKYKFLYYSKLPPEEDKRYQVLKSPFPIPDFFIQVDADKPKKEKKKKIKEEPNKDNKVKKRKVEEPEECEVEGSREEQDSE